MKPEPIVGLVVLVLGLLAALWLIPMQTTVVEGADLQPALFPLIAAWTIAVCGLVHALTGRDDPGEAVDRRAARAQMVGRYGAWRAAAVLLAGGVSAFAGFAWLGFAAAAPALMLALMLHAGERRPFWLAIGTIGVPVLVWVVFELWLSRPLP